MSSSPDPLSPVAIDHAVAAALDEISAQAEDRIREIVRHELEAAGLTDPAAVATRTRLHGEQLRVRTSQALAERAQDPSLALPDFDEDAFVEREAHRLLEGRRLLRRIRARAEELIAQEAAETSPPPA